MFLFIFVLFLALYARTTRYDEAFLPKGRKRHRSLRSLGLAIFRFFPDFVLFDGFFSKFLVFIKSFCEQSIHAYEKKARE